MKNLDLNTLKRLHLLILLGWLLPYITILHLEQIVTPFLVTLALLIIDVINSNGYSPYKNLVPLVILLNVIGLVFMTLEYVFSNYSFWQEGMGIRMAFTFAGIWIVIYAVLLAIAIGIGFLLLLIKNTRRYLRDNEPCNMLSTGRMGACSQIGTYQMQTIWRQDE